ncbi:hypothetical protein [Streptomyces sp. NBC_00038]|uniref:hypothetical protein n=1 Tax=Streptomyces sp. NBC_00038 TaxID=2903615 RepID=UPI00225871A2|nr:hypothetical protein [Streptomyces sp. NBC_00038]MCX5557275.1 hypothetical protein [Streptomyces sp. NBC_00038]
MRDKDEHSKPHKSNQYRDHGHHGDDWDHGHDRHHGHDGTTGTTATTSTTTPPGDAQWCSPGFWKNHYPEAWGPTGLTGNEKYSAFFQQAPPRSPKGISDKAQVDPTIYEVVANPQWYGGGATEDVADLLSDRHPGINFTGFRVDNCPL